MATHLDSERPVIGIRGGATIGSEAARMAAQRGALVLVFERHGRPYGELEDLVPRWHLASSGAQLGRIDENLAHPGILLLPKTDLGRDVTHAELSALGVRAVVAGGAYRERRLSIPEVERFDGDGLWHHRDFMRWYNHRGDIGYPGPEIPIAQGALVIGDGLAAIDCARAINYELYGRALASRGVQVGHERLARDGIAQTLARHGLAPVDLGVRGAVLVLPGGAGDLQLAGADAAAHGSLVATLQQRDLLDVLFHAEPVQAIEADGRLAGMLFRDRPSQAAADSGGSEATFERRADLVVSALGSAFEPATVEPVDDLEVLTVGAPLAAVAPQLMDQLLHARLWPASDDDAAVALGERLADAIQEAARKTVQSAVDAALRHPPCPPEVVARVVAWARARQQAVGYDDYSAWISATRAAWMV